MNNSQIKKFKQIILTVYNPTLIRSTVLHQSVLWSWLQIEPVLSKDNTLNPPDHEGQYIDGVETIE